MLCMFNVKKDPLLSKFLDEPDTPSSHLSAAPNTGNLY